jgi:AraC family transcriptional regulator
LHVSGRLDYFAENAGMSAGVATMTKMSLPLARLPSDHEVTHRALRVNMTWRPAGLNVARHTHELTNLAFSMEGPFEETFGTKWQRIAGRSLLVRPGGEPHANRYLASAPSRTLIIEILPHTLAEIRCETRALDTPRHLESPRFAVIARRLEFEARHPDSVSSLAIEAHVYELIVSISRDASMRDGGQPRWLSRVRDYLHSNFARTIALSDLASIAGVHPSHLAKTFRRVCGVTIGEYVRQLRVEHAAVLLKRPGLSLSEIALACGFHDQSHFTRVFAHVFGVSPGRYAACVRC